LQLAIETQRVFEVNHPQLRVAPETITHGFRLGCLGSTYKNFPCIAPALGATIPINQSHNKESVDCQNMANSTMMQQFNINKSGQVF